MSGPADINQFVMSDSSSNTPSFTGKNNFMGIFKDIEDQSNSFIPIRNSLVNTSVSNKYMPNSGNELK